MMTRLFLYMSGLLALLLGVLMAAATLTGYTLAPNLLAVESDFRIYVVDADRQLAADVTPLVAVIPEDRDPLWSPGETHEALYGYPVWSPDGGRLAFHKWYVGDNVGDIMVMDVFTREITRYNAVANYRDMISWSPDGQQIAYIFVDSPDPTERYNVAILNLEGGAHGPITRIGNVVNPLWSPGGELIAYRTLGKVSVVRAEMRLQTNGGQQLTPSGGHQSLMWSPEGDRLSLLSYSGSHDSNFASTITLIEPGHDADTLTCGDLNPELYAVWSPAWTRLATHTGRRGLTIIDMQTCEVRFTNNYNSGVPPVWLTDDRVASTSAKTLLQAHLHSGHVSELPLPGVINHITQRP